MSFLGIQVTMAPWGRLWVREGHGWGPRRERARLLSGPGQGARGSTGTSSSVSPDGQASLVGRGTQSSRKAQRHP